MQNSPFEFQSNGSKPSSFRILAYLLFGFLCMKFVLLTDILIPYFTFIFSVWCVSIAHSRDIEWIYWAGATLHCWSSNRVLRMFSLMLFFFFSFVSRCCCCLFKAISIIGICKQIEKVDRFYEELCASTWYALPRKSQLAFMLLLQSAQEPNGITVFNVLPLNANTYIKVGLSTVMIMQQHFTTILLCFSFLDVTAYLLIHNGIARDDELRKNSIDIFCLFLCVK